MCAFLLCGSRRASARRTESMSSPASNGLARKPAAPASRARTACSAVA